MKTRQVSFTAAESPGPVARSASCERNRSKIRTERPVHRRRGKRSLRHDAWVCASAPHTFFHLCTSFSEFQWPSLDDLFAYETKKVVKILDRRLGYLHLSIQLLIVCYIIVGVRRAGRLPLPVNETLPFLSTVVISPTSLNLLLVSQI